MNAYLNDILPNCVLASSWRASQIWNPDYEGPTEDEIRRTFKDWCHVTACHYSWVLRRWFLFGLDGKRLGCCARLRGGASAVQKELARDPKALVLVSMDSFMGVASHSVLLLEIRGSYAFVFSWGVVHKIDAVTFFSDMERAWLILPHWSWRAAFLHMKNTPGYWTIATFPALFAVLYYT